MSRAGRGRTDLAVQVLLEHRLEEQRATREAKNEAHDALRALDLLRKAANYDMECQRWIIYEESIRLSPEYDPRAQALAMRVLRPAPALPEEEGRDG